MKSSILIFQIILIFSVFLSFFATEQTNEARDNEIVDHEVDDEVELTEEFKSKRITFKTAASKFNDKHLLKFPDHIYDVIHPDDLVYLEPKDPAELEKKYEAISDPLTKKLFKELRVFSRHFIDRYTLKILVYRFLVGDGEFPLTKEEKFLYHLVTNEIFVMASDATDIGDIYDYLMGDSFNDAMEKVLLTYFGQKGLDKYKQSYSATDL